MNANAPELRLRPQRATMENIAAYGQLLEARDTTERLGLRFYADSVAVRRITAFRSDEQTELAVARVSARAPQVLYMERHFKHTQVFVPLGEGEITVVLAPPECEGLPSPDDLRAFRLPEGTALLMHIGTWHEFPFATDRPASLMVILRSEATEGLMQEGDLPNEAVGPDLEKRDVVARWQRRVFVDL